ncbi:MAG: hypothetical protein DWP98_12195 [Bacteroidetes bacterium]|nr:MAG: hypothetical protein DWP98_12195 [Bacteroidota bacterium]
MTDDTPYFIVTPNTDIVINENNNLTYETDFFFAGSDINKVVGFVIKPGALKSTDTKQGLMIETLQENKFQIHFPEENYLYDTYLSRSGYYRCAKNTSYQLSARFSNLGENTVVKYTYKILDIKHTLCYQQATFKKLRKENNQYSGHIEIPETLTHKPIDDCLYLFITIEILKPLDKFFVHNINLTQIVNSDETSSPSLSVNSSQLLLSDHRYIKKTNLLKSSSGSLSIKNKFASNTLFTVTPNIQWQIRNATAQLTKNEIHIQSLRHNFQKVPEIILTPTSNKSHFINRLKNILSCVISYHQNSIKLSQIKKNKKAEIVFHSNSPSIEITGGKQKKHLHDGSFIIVLNIHANEVLIRYTGNINAPLESAKA